jgi:hypothetical protein
MEQRIERIIQIVAGVALVVGCLMVLGPFLRRCRRPRSRVSIRPAYRLIERLGEGAFCLRRSR